MIVGALDPSLPGVVVSGVFKDPFSLGCSSEPRPVIALQGKIYCCHSLGEISSVGSSWLLPFSNTLLQLLGFTSRDVGHACPATVAARDCVQSSISPVDKGLRSPASSNRVLRCYESNVCPAMSDSACCLFQPI